MFLRNLSRHLKEGMEVVVELHGIEYSGKIISLDMGNPQDAGMIIENKDGIRRLIPINQNACISFTVDSEEEEIEEEKTYDEMEIPELRDLCSKRKIKFSKNFKKRALVNLLNYADRLKESRKKSKSASK